MEIEGRIIKILPSRSGNKDGKDWIINEFLIQTFGNYPKDICLQTKLDLSSLKIGEQVKCQIEPSSKEYNGKYYTQINTWKIELTASTHPAEKNYTNPAQTKAEPVDLAQMTEPSDDVLPF